MYHSTPLLVFYAIVLLLIQYLYNLDLTERELESNVYAGLTRYSPPPDGANVLAIVIKVWRVSSWSYTYKLINLWESLLAYTVGAC